LKHSTEAGTIGVPIGVPMGMVDVVDIQSNKITNSFITYLEPVPEPEPEPEPSVSR
jgi:hypothetical protein